MSLVIPLLAALSSSWAATDPAAAYLQGPAANLLGSYVLALEMSLPGSDSHLLLSRLSCAAARDLLLRAGWVTTEEKSVEELTGQAMLVIRSLEPRCEPPEVELLLKPATQDGPSLLGQRYDPAALGGGGPRAGSPDKERARARRSQKTDGRASEAREQKKGRKDR